MHAAARFVGNLPYQISVNPALSTSTSSTQQSAVVTISTTQVFLHFKTSSSTFLPEHPVLGLKMLSPKYKLLRRAFRSWPSGSYEDDIWAQVLGKKLPRGAQPERGPGEHLHEGDPDTQHDSQQEDRSGPVSSKRLRVTLNYFLTLLL